MSVSVGKSGIPIAAVRKRFDEPRRTSSTFAELQMIMSKPAVSAAEASSALFAVTCVHFLRDLWACISAMVTDRNAGFALQVYTRFIRTPQLLPTVQCTLPKISLNLPMHILNPASKLPSPG